jgi:thiol-disulfide isomerase/thioredoxin
MNALRCLGLTLFLIASAPAQAVQEGQAAPAFRAKLLDGSSFSLDTAQGDVVLINFWATWCAPCRKEMPALEAYYAAHRAQGLRIIAVSMDEAADEPKVRDLMSGYSFAAALKGDANFRGYGRIWRIPLTFVIDRGGKLRKDAWSGDAGLAIEDLESAVTPLLAPR